MFMIHEKVDIITLSDNMANSKEELLSYIEHFNGKQSQEYEDAEFLVRNTQDLKQWFERWQGDADKLHETNQLLREWKINQHKMSNSEFVDSMLLDARDCLETVFQQRIMNRTMIELDKALGEDLTFEMLYEKHMEMPNVRVEYLI